MKKTLLAVLVVILAVSCFAMVTTAAAATDVSVSNTPTDRGYFKYAPFEDFEAGISGAAVVYGANTHTWATDDDGNRALSTSQGDSGYPGQVFSMGTSNEVGTYFVEFDVKPVKNVVAATVLFGTPQGQSGAHFAQIGLSFNSDLSEVTIADGAAVGGWPVTNYKNSSISKLENGYWHVYFEYDVTSEMSSASHLVFCQRATVNGDNAVQWDNISYGNLAKAADYYNIDWNVDYGALTNVWAEQPIWANSGSVEADYFGTGVSALKINATDTNNTQIGGIVNTAGNDKKIAKNPVMTYYQFDVAVEDLSMVNIWTSGCYTAVIFNGSAWHVEGGAINLKAVQLDKGWRLSYFIDMGAANAANMEFNINSTGTGAVYFANLLVAQIDTVRAPWVSEEVLTYNTVEPHDVAVNLDAKGKAITSVKIGDDAVDAANYSYAGETLTLKSAAFTGKAGDLTCTAATDGGSVEFTVTQEQTKIPLTASLVSTDPINKYVDGTTDVKQAIELSLTGEIADGHDVKLAYTAAYDSAEVGTGRKITISLSLTGNHAALYELTNTALEIAGCEIYDYITVTPEYKGQPVEKYEDGTTNVASGSIALTLTGLANNDEVSCTFNAVYDAATAGNRKINITNIVLTGKDAYKYNLSVDTLEIDGKIIERTTVTPSYDGIIEKRFDGTTYLNTKGIQLALSDIADGDEVTATFRAFFTSANAGECQVEISDIELTGKDAYKYKLAKDSFNVDAYIAEVRDVAISDGKGYYTMDGQTLQKYDFESVTTGNIAANAINGLYVAPANGEVGNGVTQTASVAVEDGSKVLKIEENCFAWSTQLFSTNATGGYREQGIYAVSFKVKPVNASIIGVLVRNGYATNDGSSILADYRYSVSYDGTGKAISTAKELQGFLGANQKYVNGRADVDSNGWIDCYFEFELSSGITYGDDFCPVVIFTGANVSGQSVSTYYFDDIKYICKSTSNKYMTIDHNYDMEGTNGAEATNTPFYSALENGFVYDNEWTNEFVQDNTVVRLDIPANNNDQVGALKNSVADGALRLFKGEGLHYVQFDFDTTCAQFNLFSLGFFDIKCETKGDGYVFTLEVYSGLISNFKTEKAANGMTRVSFLADITGLDRNNIHLNLKAVTSSTPGEIYFDNLFVSHEDYTPLTADAEYDFVDMQDVAIDVDLKGARLLGVELDGTAVATDKFVYDAATGKLTLDKSLFATTNPNAAARTITIKTSAGDITATASIVDNRPDVTLGLEYTGDAISKDYDGTTDVEQSVIDAIVAQITMSGVTEGDDVTLTYDIAYSSKNAGAVTIVISNIALAGSDAVKYSLKTTSLSVDATINKIQLTVSGTTAANKEYDGTTTAAATAGTLGGVLTGENVTLSASAVFNSKNVSEANKVTVTYVLSGDDAANYLAPASDEVTASITKKTVTVTADAKSIKVGDNDPELTYKVSGLIEGDVLSGALSREQGTEAGEYNILQGTLSGGDNYEINFVSAKLTITKAADKPTEPVEPTEPEKLSAGAIAGIVVGSVAVAGGAAAAVVFIIKKRRLK